MLTFLPGVARAQFGGSIYNLTGVETELLPNAVRITLRTDGAAVFGTNLDDIIKVNADYSSFPVSHLRIRLLHCRSVVPSLIKIGQYPVDFASVNLGDIAMSSPFFLEDPSGTDDPRIDVDLHFYVPVTVQRFLRGDQDYWINNRYNDYLHPLEASVTLGEDRSSVVITILTDKVDRAGATSIIRSGSQFQHRHLNVSINSDGSINLGALHEPLNDVLVGVSDYSHLSFNADSDAGDLDVSASLNGISAVALVQEIARAYNLVYIPDNAGIGGGILSRGSSSVRSEELPLLNLSPDKARLLFPDFLLPDLHSDRGNNSLVVTGSQQLIDHVRQNLSVIDNVAPEAEITLKIWQLQHAIDLNSVLTLGRALRRDGESISPALGETGVIIGPGQMQQIRANLQALISRNLARLKVDQFVKVKSGETGSVFSGQTRTIQILENQYGGQTAVAQEIPVGYTLVVTPVIALDSIDLTIDAKVSTLDSVAAVTGLPTLGVQEVTTQVEISPGDSVIIAGSNSSQEDFDKGKTLPLGLSPLLRTLTGSTVRSTEDQMLLLLISARKVD